MIFHATPISFFEKCVIFKHASNEITQPPGHLTNPKNPLINQIILKLSTLTSFIG